MKHKLTYTHRWSRHKALPCASFTNLRIGYYWSFSTSPTPLTENDIQRARQIGDLFGNEFAIPITLAILCCVQRDPNLWIHGVSTRDLGAVIRGIKGLTIPESWRKSHPVVGHAINHQNFGDTKQMTMLVRAVMRHLKQTNNANMPTQVRSEISEDEILQAEDYDQAVGASNVEQPDRTIW